MNGIRTQPLIGDPFSVAVGAEKPTSVLPVGMSNCHPTNTNVYPCFSRYASPNSASDLKSVALVARLNTCSRLLLPRFTTSKNKTPLPFAVSFGRRTVMSEENSTRP
jgi:hypothetical protein